MKKLALKVFSMMAFVCLLSAAGYSQQLILKANVPFDFTVGKKVFPAGEYNVVRIAPHTLSLRDANGGFLMSVVTEPIISLTSHSNPKLRFETIGGQYVLTEVWPDSATTGYELLGRKQVNYVAQTAPATVGQALATYTGK